MNSVMNDFYVTTRLEEMDQPWVIEHLRKTYFGSWRSAELITESMRNSLCFGLFEREVLSDVIDGSSHLDRQVGFARVVTDYATVANVVDVYIAETCRGMGLGKFLLGAVCNDHRIRHLVQILRTKPETEGFYSQAGFEKVFAMRRMPEGIK